MTEKRLQIQVARWLDHIGAFWIHVPSEGTRNARVGAVERMMGARPGVPDILILQPSEDHLRPFTGLAIELKTGRGQLSAAQMAWMDQARAWAWVCATCRSLDEVKALVRATYPKMGRGE